MVKVEKSELIRTGFIVKIEEVICGKHLELGLAHC